MGVSNAAPWSSWIQAQDANNNATNYPLLLNPNGGNLGIGTDNPGAKTTVWADDGVTDRDVFQVRSKTGLFNIQVSDSDASLIRVVIKNMQMNP